MEKYVLRIFVYSTVLNNMKPQLCFFLEKPSLVDMNVTVQEGQPEI